MAQPRGSFQLAALEPADRPAPPAKPPIGMGPFGLAAASDGPYDARWRLLQPLIGLEGQILALCRSGSMPCSPAAAKFNVIVEAARARSGRARVGEVNRAVNLAIRPMSDQAQYGAPDIWASPLMTFASGAGDCEDYAIAKYVALTQAGMPTADLRLVVVHDRRTDEGHMVAAARVDGDWLILDNRTMRLVADREVPDLTPLAALGGEQAAPAIAAAPKPQRAASPAEAWNTAGLAVVL
jgi:predicted transglutaminase-like cysteine proteinase